jgi:hypothetical protein
MSIITKLLGSFVQKAWSERAVDAQTLQLRAEQGDSRAQYALGERCYDQLLEEDAAAWFEKAALQGHSRAQHNLGMMHILGRGVPRNLVDAYTWLTIAESQGYEKARDVRAKIWKKLSPEELECAQLKAARFVAKPTILASPPI